MTSYYKGEICGKFSFQEGGYILGLGVYVYKPLSIEKLQNEVA